MPHQCVHCGEMYPDGSKEILSGCSCGSHFFYYLKKEYIQKPNRAIEEKIEEINSLDKEKIEKDVREMIGIKKEDVPVILDLESVRVLGPGKFEIDVVNLFSKKRPLIYKLEEGKYIIDLARTININSSEFRKKKGKTVEELEEDISEEDASLDEYADDNKKG